MDGEENTLDTSWLDIMVSKLLPNTLVQIRLEQIPGSGTSTDGYLFYTVEAKCNQFIPCSDKELTCVVYTK